jgi:ABC-type uncharacterized transport system permease subunit
MTTIDRAPVHGMSTTLLPRSWKTPIAFTVFTVLAFVLFVLFGRSGTSVFGFTDTSSAGAPKLPSLPLPSIATSIVLVFVAAVITVVAYGLSAARRKVPLWLTTAYAVVLVIAFLVWSAAGHTLQITGLFVGALALSTPLIFGALGGVISERVGIVNVAIEGQLLAGAFLSAVVASITHDLWAGVIAAMVAGMLVSFVLAAFAIKYLVDQVIVGIVLNVLVLGVTNFLYQTVLVNATTTLNQPPQFADLPIPLLSKIPVIGPTFFDQSIIIYLMYIAVIGVSIGLFRTRWGLRLRAVGEHPTAADTVGINVARSRFWNTAIAGAIVGLGGAYFTLGSVGAFSEDMTSGVGFIALAAVIFGRWDPIRATLAALLFGFVSNLQNVLGILGSPVPNDFMLMLPYLVTIFAVAGAVGRARGPAASGRPYVKS